MTSMPEPQHRDRAESSALVPTPTPSQTVGPFFGYALPYDGGDEVAPPWRPDAIRLHGTVLDGDGQPIPDALLEFWGADASGRPIRELGSLHRDHHTVTGFGRVPTLSDGRYGVTTVKPGAGRPGIAPFIVVAVFARGLLHHLFTRAYFDDEVEANAADPFLNGIAADRMGTLIAAVDGVRSYRFDIRLQGENETVFLDLVGDGRG
jgi:protocatechuate 3,4-dioxygenase alpha subunit